MSAQTEANHLSAAAVIERIFIAADDEHRDEETAERIKAFFNILDGKDCRSPVDAYAYIALARRLWHSALADVVNGEAPSVEVLAQGVIYLSKGTDFIGKLLEGPAEGAAPGRLN
ncbi:hypothetical protein [Shinella sp. HZN7]|uniref:hypothetical protein n=1 Tax=Shinella sp. (strain HZN7) TaxID=879274 RepID=UPI0007DA88FF|nr:hypothetical protein [Shinella sp. HZN7]ANH05032.1 hypothetical protein shn_13940 [Shinella sp. HZN7]